MIEIKLLDDTPTAAPERPEANRPQFPPAFFQAPFVDVQALHASPYEVDETTYLALGGGLGSFVWVDYLRVAGVPAAHVAAIGFEDKPYGRYRRLASNSQIPDHERLRSNSDACPDNLWGWPGYGVREMWSWATRGRLLKAGKIGFQLLTEPLLIEPFTPRSGDVYHAIDQEAERIGWAQIWRYGRIRAIRKTTDGRYAVAYSQDNGRTAAQRYKFFVAPFVHVAVGYPAVRFLPDLQAYREETADFEHVVNAYEDHHHVYEELEQHGGTVLIRGRGIVASRVIQRLYEARQNGAAVGVIHLMRSKIEQGSRHGLTARPVNHHWELQPYNFPKACFGGDLKKKLEQLPAEEREQLTERLGGTTTAERADWQAILENGRAEGWYQVRFGEVERVSREGNKIVTRLASDDLIDAAAAFYVDYVIDCTGLHGNVRLNPLLDDLIEMYQLPTNRLERMVVTDDYEITDMRNGRGRLYAAGAMTYGNGFAPVDSFLGLQYVAQRSAEALVAHETPFLKPLEGGRSLAAWWRWARGVQP